MDAITNLFFRDGRPATGNVRFDEKGKAFTMVAVKCDRCGGQGGSEAWKHTGWTCYKCSGRCWLADREETLYTAEKLEKLNATRARTHAKKAAKLEVLRLGREAAAAERRQRFEAEYADVLPWLSAAGMDGEDYREGFLGDMLSRANQHADWTPGQADAVRKAFAKAQERDRIRAASGWLGTEKQRLTLTVVVEGVKSFERAQFGASWLKETVYIVSMRTEEGAAVVSKSPQFHAQKGAKMVIKGTVKEHTEYQGQKQTVLQRVQKVEVKEFA